MTTPQDIIVRVLMSVDDRGTYETDAQAILKALKEAGYLVVERRPAA